MTLTEKSDHLAWCALVALALARQDGGVLSPAQENLFLTRWLATALNHGPTSMLLLTTAADR
ncbi:DUF2913 family protein [Salmonella enterica]|nr:DUF2913 family protein [Salmonella enterica]